MYNNIYKIIKQKRQEMLKKLFPSKLAYELIPTDSDIIAEIDNYINEL